MVEWLRAPPPPQFMTSNMEVQSPQIKIEEAVKTDRKVMNSRNQTTLELTVIKMGEKKVRWRLGICAHAAEI